MILNRPNQRLHFIGIGGIGMSAIAHVLLDQGYQITGSDMKEGFNTEKLKEKGATIYIGHQASNVHEASFVFYSSAVTPQNVEIKEAKKLGIPIVRRAEILSETMRFKYGVAIAGTHGKTTTTAMVSTILENTGKDPTYIIGGLVPNLGGHAKVGEGQYIVVEADESDGSFLSLNPVYSVITNIDTDHMDFYGTENKLKKSFVEFANKIPFYGHIVVNTQDPFIQQIQKKIKRPLSTFGLGEGADYEAKNMKFTAAGAEFELLHMNESIPVSINLPGEHNVLNALAAISICHKMGLSLGDISGALKKFTGVGRRFETIFDDGKLVVIDDYGHHPTEVVHTIQTARTVFDKKLVVIFQPHRYSRTRDCWDDFKVSFNKADELYLTPIYPASEEPLEGVTSEALGREIQNTVPVDVNVLRDLDQIPELFQKYKDQEAVLLFLGAGTIGPMARNSLHVLD